MYLASYWLVHMILVTVKRIMHTNSTVIDCQSTFSINTLDLHLDRYFTDIPIYTQSTLVCLSVCLSVLIDTISTGSQQSTKCWLNHMHWSKISWLTIMKTAMNNYQTKSTDLRFIAQCVLNCKVVDILQSNILSIFSFLRNFKWIMDIILTAVSYQLKIALKWNHKVSILKYY